jgi:hypothetical protein
MSPHFCFCGNLSLPTTGIGSIQIAQSNIMPTTAVEKKCISAFMHVPEALTFQ